MLEVGAGAKVDLKLAAPSSAGVRGKQDHALMTLMIGPGAVVGTF